MRSEFVKNVEGCINYFIICWDDLAFCCVPIVVDKSHHAPHNQVKGDGEDQ